MRHTTTRGAAVLVFVAFVGGSCASLAPTVPTTEPRSTEGFEAGVEESLVEDTPDGVSFEEYESSVRQLVNCMQEAGAAITEPAFDASSGLYRYDYDPAGEAVYQDCFESAFGGLDTTGLGANPEVPESEVSGPVGDWSGAASGSWLALLDSVPLTPNTRWAPTTIIDFARASDAFGIDRPGPDANGARVLSYLGDLAASAGIVPAGPLAAFGRSAYPDQVRTELGFDHRDFDQLLGAGVGSYYLVIGRGGFDSGAIEVAVNGDPVWSSMLETTEHEGVSMYSWGLDLDIDLDHMSPTRPTGHSRRLAVAGDEIVWARWTTGAIEAIDAIVDQGRSLADVESLRSLAVIGDDAGLFSGVITASVAEWVTDIAGSRSVEHLVARPDALLLGDGVDDEGRFTLIALQYVDSAIAEAEMQLFTARMELVAGQESVDGLVTELDEPRAFETAVIGSTLIAKLWLTDDPMVPAGELVVFE
ncbi:MAG: hypothetical protein GY925_11590 [Actinomycetia bacterium]|nr:hypothetical protein [Actinomycetes bacterium]